MNEMNHESSPGTTADIRIVAVNRDKTRKAHDTDECYQVFFMLSSPPHRAWSILFETEWEGMKPVPPLQRYKAAVDNGFLVLECPLAEVPRQLPILMTAVEATNRAYTQLLQRQATEHERREDVWTDERKAVNDMADTLVFNGQRGTRI